MKLLKAEGIYKSYKESDETLEILKGVDLSVDSGETIAITGASGSGKSTLLHILGLLDSPDRGSLWLKDKKISPSQLEADKYRNSNLGFIFQFHYLLEDFTALENVALPGFYLTGNRKKSESKAREILKNLNLSHRLGHYPNQLSGGEQQRVAVARALINDPDLVFADEPTGNLDNAHSEELMNLLLAMNKEKGQTIVLVTHDQNIANMLNSHYILQNGVLHTP